MPEKNCTACPSLTPEAFCRARIGRPDRVCGVLGVRPQRRGVGRRLPRGRHRQRHRLHLQRGLLRRRRPLLPLQVVRPSRAHVVAVPGRQVPWERNRVLSSG